MELIPKYEGSQRCQQIIQQVGMINIDGCWCRAIFCVPLFLVYGLSHHIVAASPPAATPEPTFPTSWYAPGPAAGEDSFWHSLEEGDAPAALEIVEENIGPASASPAGSSGLTEEYSVTLISDIATQAATDLTQSTGSQGDDAGREKPINQQLYDSTWNGFLSALETSHATQASVIQGFADAIYESMYSQTFSGELGPDLRPSLLQLAHSAGLDQAVTDGFILARNRSLTVLDAGAALNTLSNTGVTIDPAVKAMAQAAAVNAFGLTSKNLQLADGNVSSIADFMFGSAFLGTGDPMTSAQNLSRVVLSSHLPLDTQYQVFVQAIGQTLQQAQPEAAAVLLAAALAASETAAGSQGFALAKTAPLQVLCACQASAQSISLAGRLAASSAIPPVFGIDPCKLFQGSVGALYRYNRTSDYPWEEFNGAQTVCSATVFYDRGEPQPLRSDCDSAIAQLQANGSTVCVAPSKSAALTQEPSSVTPLAVVGTCQLALGGTVGACLSSSQVAEYAVNLATACEDSQMATAGTVTPRQNETDLTTYIVLSRV